MIFRAVVLAAVASFIVSAHAQTITKAMSFDACLETIRLMATQLGVAPVNIVETSILRMVRFPAADGSVLVTCSGADRKMILQQSRNTCGDDVEC